MPATLPITGKNEPTTPPATAPASPNNAAPPLVAAPVALSAQAPYSGSVLHVSPYAGVMVFGNYLKGPLNTTLTNKPGMLYGTQVGLSLSPELSLVGNIGYTSSDLDVGLPIIGGLSVGHSSTLIYDAREHAIGLIRDEANAIGADDVVGVKTHIHEHNNLLEFMAIGTAVKKMPNLTTLSASLPPQAIIKDKDTWIGG